MRRLSGFVFLMQCAAVFSTAAQRNAFVTTLGADTLSLEQYERAGNTVTGDWVTLYGGVLDHHYVMSLHTDGTVDHLRLDLRRLNGTSEGSVDLVFDGDSLTVRLPADTDGVRRVAAARAFPVLGRLAAFYEAITMRARRLGDSSVVAAISAFGPFRAGSVPVAFYASDSARIGNPLAPIYARVDREGHIDALSFRATTTRAETRRVPAFDVIAVARHFPDTLTKPVAGAPALSPRDTARATFGGATVSIDYGRPSVRGRNVFSHGVLGDTLWRAGANAATQITTTADLLVAGKTLPAGTYSMWVHARPDNSAYELLFNRQVGQWGTEHHYERDFLSVPLQARRVASPTEQLTMELAPRGNSETLVLRWSTLELSTSLAVK